MRVFDKSFNKIDFKKILFFIYEFQSVASRPGAQLQAKTSENSVPKSELASFGKHVNSNVRDLLAVSSEAYHILYETKEKLM